MSASYFDPSIKLSTQSKLDVGLGIEVKKTISIAMAMAKNKFRVRD